MAYFWVLSTGKIPPNALQAGVDKDGDTIYVGRAVHEGHQIPAKVLKNKHVAYVPYAGKEHAKHVFDVLCTTGTKISWKIRKDGKIRKGAVSCSNSGELLYIGRVNHDGTVTPGKIQPSHGCCYIPFNGQEVRYTEYEVLSIK